MRGQASPDGDVAKVKMTRCSLQHLKQCWIKATMAIDNLPLSSIEYIESTSLPFPSWVCEMLGAIIMTSSLQISHYQYAFKRQEVFNTYLIKYIGNPFGYLISLSFQIKGKENIFVFFYFERRKTFTLGCLYFDVLIHISKWHRQLKAHIVIRNSRQTPKNILSLFYIIQSLAFLHPFNSYLNAQRVTYRWFHAGNILKTCMTL